MWFREEKYKIFGIGDLELVVGGYSKSGSQREDKGQFRFYRFLLGVWFLF